MEVAEDEEEEVAVMVVLVLFSTCRIMYSLPHTTYTSSYTSYY